MSVVLCVQRRHVVVLFDEMSEGLVGEVARLLVVSWFDVMYDRLMVDWLIMVDWQIMVDWLLVPEKFVDEWLGTVVRSMWVSMMLIVMNSVILYVLMRMLIVIAMGIELMVWQVKIVVMDWISMAFFVTIMLVRVVRWMDSFEHIMMRFFNDI